MAIIYIIKITDYNINADESLFYLLPEKRIEKMKKYVNAEDRIRCFVSGICALTTVSEFVKSSPDKISLVTDTGKAPYAFYKNNIIRLSISHSGKYVVCMADEKPCGADTEEKSNSEDFIEIAKNYYHKNEIQKMTLLKNFQKKIDYFFFIWTMKEAYLKHIGMGLIRSLSSFEIQKKEGEIVINDKENQFSSNLRCMSFFEDGNFFSFVSETQISEIHLMSCKEMLEFIHKLLD